MSVQNGSVDQDADSGRLDELPHDEDGELDEEAFDEVLAEQASPGDSVTDTMTRLGMRANEQASIGMWAEVACPMAKQMGINDGEAADFMVSDLDGDVNITKDQAAEIWASIKTTC